MSQENNFIPNQENYKPLTPFQLFVKSNFPFIENTFEALDNYGLYCKIVEYLNDVIANENTVESNVQELYNSFVSLNNYVSNYFDNLDVQEEINNKLDDLVLDGTITNLINNEVFYDINNRIDYVNQSLDEKIDDLEASTQNQFTTVQENLLAQINNVKNATPIPVTSTDQMTDTTKIYVLSTDGKWYYYNGSAWTAGGTYQATSIADNSIYTPQVKTLDINKINKKGYYVKAISGAGAISHTYNDSIINLTATDSQVISTDKSGFEIYFYNTKSTTFMFALFEITGNNTDMLVYFPDNSFSTPSYITNNGNYYYVYNDKAGFITYLNQHVNEYIRMRILFTNSDGLSVTIKPKYFGNNGITLDNNGFYKGINPYINSPANNYGISEITDNSITFNFNSSKGLKYNIPYIDVSKNLVIETNLLDGNDIDIFFVWVDTNSQTHYNTDASQKITETNNKRVISKEYLNENNITQATIVFASTDANIVNPYESTISIPYIIQFDYSGDLTETFNLIKNQMSGITSRLYNKSLAVNGDSMAYGHSLPRNQVWDSLIASRNSMTLNNYAQNGKFITRHYFNSGTVTEYDENNPPANPGLVDSISSMGDNKDYIAINCGTNDMQQSITLGSETDTGYTTFYGCLYNVCLQLINKYPTSNILFITPYPRLTRYDHDTPYIEAIIKMCERFGITYYDSRQGGLCRTNETQQTALMLDDTHLNQTGMLRISYRYESVLKSL